MTIQQKIEENAKRGLFSVLQHNTTKMYQMVSPIKTKNGFYNTSADEITIENCPATLGEYVLDNPQDNVYYTYIKSLSFQDIVPIEPYKVGDRVDISDAIEKWKGYYKMSSSAKETVYHKGLKIRSVELTAKGLFYEVYTKDESDYWYFRHEWLTPHFVEETPTVEQEAIELLKKHGYKITKE